MLSFCTLCECKVWKEHRAASLFDVWLPVTSVMGEQAVQRINCGFGAFPTLLRDTAKFPSVD
jgi:hypothetical protein